MSLLIIIFFACAMASPFLFALTIEAYNTYKKVKLYPITVTEIKKLLDENPDSFEYGPNQSVVFDSGDGKAGFGIAQKGFHYKNSINKMNAFVVFNDKVSYFEMIERHQNEIHSHAAKILANKFKESVMEGNIKKLMNDSNKAVDALNAVKKL